MKMKRYWIVAVTAALALTATGCGEGFPEMTDEQYAQTVEYAAGLLMKYSNNGQEKLVHVDAKEVQRQREKEAAANLEASQAAEEETTSKKSGSVKKNTNTDASSVNNEDPTAFANSESEGNDPSQSSDVDVQDDESTQASSGSSEELPEEDPDAITLTSDESQEIIPDIFLSYQGYSVSSVYPESSKSYAVYADKGERLLVLRFDLYNGSDSAKEVNMIPLNLLFEIILNGENIGYSAVTFLPNDLASFTGTIDSRAKESVVVLTQISESDAKNIDSLGMIVSLKGEEQKVILK